MKIIYTLIISLLFTSSIFSQAEFQSGYYIDNDGKVIPGYIKNLEWKKNPNDIEFKLAIKGNASTIKISDISEFRIAPDHTYRRFKTKMDTSSVYVADYSRNRASEYKEGTYLLQVLIEGDISLYKYTSENYTQYFYQLNDKLVPLEYKKYENRNGQIYENKAFIQHIKNKLKCNKKVDSKVSGLKYNDKSLVNFFIDLANCKDFATKQIISFDKPILVITPRASWRSSTMTVRNHTEFWDTNMDYAFSPSLGVEIEYVVPYYNDKWSLIFEPSFNYFETDNSREQKKTGTDKYMYIRYTSIEFPAGFRYYMHLNRDTKLFVNSFFTIDYAIQGDNIFRRAPGFPDNEGSVDSFVGLGAGFGVKKNRLSVELRYQGFREIFINQIFWTTNFQTTSLHVGYTIVQ
jgi:hypothetical protein